MAPGPGVRCPQYAGRVATTLLLARHGESDWNALRRVQGHTDRPLTARGHEQARALAEELDGEELDAVYASDLARALDTARAVADRRGLGVLPLPELREKHFGSWEGLTDDEVNERHPEARLGHWGDGETPEELSARIFAALGRIAAAHPGGRVLVVTHGGPLHAVLRECSVETDGSIGNCHVARIEIQGRGMRSVD